MTRVFPVTDEPVEVEFDDSVDDWFMLHCADSTSDRRIRYRIGFPEAFARRRSSETVMHHLSAMRRLSDLSNQYAPSLATDFFGGRLADSQGAVHHELRRVAVTLSRLASDLELVRRQPGFTACIGKELSPAEIDDLIREALASSAVARDAVRYVDLRLRDARLRNQTPTTIKFYRRDEPYFELTNFSLHPIALDGALWPTVEHYFQAQKHTGTDVYEKIRWARSPEEAKRLANQGQFDFGAWSRRREDVMRVAIGAKFRQNLRPLSVLIGTGDARLVEASPHDDYWGAGSDGKGRNRLGELLMELRDLLRDEEGERRADSD